MLDISIRELNEIISGQLQFGSMPPLGGALEMIRNVIPQDATIQDRDVVVFENVDDQKNDFFAEAAYAKGAIGVIANRMVTPWDGCFCIRIPQVKTGLIRLADWCYRRFPGVRVAIVSKTGDTSVADQIRQESLNLSTPLAEPLPWQLIDLHTEDSHAVVNFTLGGTCRESLDICEPDVIVFSDRNEENDEQTSKLATKMIKSINRNGTVILPYHDEEIWQLASQRGSEILVINDGPRLDGDTQSQQLAQRTMVNIQQRLEAIAQAEKERQIKAELARAKAQERKRA
jgi:hypothetical protein